MTLLCYVSVSLLAKASMHKHEQKSGSRKLTSWGEMKAWVAEMTSGLESSDKPSAKNHQRQSFPFCLLAVLNSRRTSNKHVSMYCWTLKINFIIDKLRLFFSRGEVESGIGRQSNFVTHLLTAIQQCQEPWTGDWRLFYCALL